jgi:TetR/AcrR family transcriptional regulator
VAVSRPRLPAEERRAALLDCACETFARGSYRGTTTAELAAAAGVTEPVLYRHFDSKRALYLACHGETWARVRALWDEAVAAEPDSSMWVAAMGRAFIESEEHRPVISNLWVQALAESAEEPDIGDYMRDHMREVHAYVAGVIGRAQEAGGIERARDPDAEAWIFIALGLLSMADRVLGGLMADRWEVIRASRLHWLTGR